MHQLFKLIVHAFILRNFDYDKVRNKFSNYLIINAEREGFEPPDP